MGGIERAMSTLANYFVIRGHEVYFITIFSFPQFFTLNKNVKLIISPFEYNKKSNFFEFVKYYFKIFSPFRGYLRRTIKKINPDVSWIRCEKSEQMFCKERNLLPKNRGKQFCSPRHIDLSCL